MSENGEKTEDAQAKYLRDNGWHTDPAEPRRWRHPSMPHLDPQTLTQATEIQRNAVATEGRSGAGPGRTH